MATFVSLDSLPFGPCDFQVKVCRPLLRFVKIERVGGPGMRSSMTRTRLGLLAAAVLCLAGGVVPLGQQAEAAGTCAGGTSSDFNGDGVTDTVIADPQATVDGATRAGLVRVVLGGGKGDVEISQASAGVAGTPERGDEFGFSQAVYDVDKDGCSDLVIGTPYEDIPTSDTNALDAGGIWVVHGAAVGFGATSPVEEYNQAQLDPTSAVEAYDRFGYALQAGSTSGGDPYLIVGVPGENLTVDGTSYADAGGVDYVLGSTVTSVNESTPGVPGVVEAHDRFGYSLAGTDRYFAVGAPGESIGTARFAGAATVFSHTLTSGKPTPLLGLDQETAGGGGLSGTAEPGDGLGTSLSMTSYRPGGQSFDSDALLAIGIPGEDIGTTADAGAADVVRVQPDGTCSELTPVDAEMTDVEGDPTAGDFMGQRVTIANTSPGTASSADTIELGVGIPGHDVGSVEEAGAVQVFHPLAASIGADDKLLVRGGSDGLVPGTATDRDYVGISLASGSSALSVGVPFSKSNGTPRGALYVIPWSDVEGATSTGTTVYKPGADGIPDAGTSFGVVG